MGKRFIANKEILRENIERLKETKGVSTENIDKNRKILADIRKDQKENGKYYYHNDKSNTYNPFKEFFDNQKNNNVK